MPLSHEDERVVPQEQGQRDGQHDPFRRAGHSCRESPAWAGGKSPGSTVTYRTWETEERSETSIRQQAGECFERRGGGGARAASRVLDAGCRGPAESSCWGLPWFHRRCSVISLSLQARWPFPLERPVAAGQKVTPASTLRAWNRSRPWSRSSFGSSRPRRDTLRHPATTREVSSEMRARVVALVCIVSMLTVTSSARSLSAGSSPDFYGDPSGDPFDPAAAPQNLFVCF